MGVDVVKLKDGSIKVIDLEELEQLPPGLRKYAERRVSIARDFLAGDYVEKLVDEAKGILEREGQV